MGNRAYTGKYWRACAALTLALLFSLLVDFSGVSSSTGHPVEADRLPRLIGTLFLLGYATLAALRPKARITRCIGPALLALLVAGILCLVAGIATGAGSAFSASTWLLALGQGWLIVTACTAVTRLERRAIPPALVTGFGLASLGFLLLGLAPPLVRAVALVVSAAASPPLMNLAVSPEEDPASLPAEQPIAEGLDELAAKHGLSPRETQVFLLLARGRNREYVQESLVVSKDTAKAHIKHVYAKLGVHSQQELLDLVDESLGRGAVE